MKVLYLAMIGTVFLVFSGINLVFAQTTTHVMGKFLFSPETQNLMMRSCGKINDLGGVDPQVMQFVRQNNPNTVVSDNNAQQLFWNTLYTKFVSQVPEFKSLGGKNDTISIEMRGYAALSCPPIQGGNATFQVNGNQLTYKIGFYSDSQAFYYKSISILHTTQNQTTSRPLPLNCCNKSVIITSDSPLKQFKSGIAAKDVICKQGMQLIFKAEDGSPACAKPQTAFRLVELGWGLEDSSTTESMNIDNTKFSANYTITYAKILNIKMDTQSLALIVTMQSSGDGNLIMEIPQELLKDSNSNLHYDGLVVLNDGQESSYKEISSTHDTMTLLIPFVNGTKQIEIIGAYY